MKVLREGQLSGSQQRLLCVAGILLQRLWTPSSSCDAGGMVGFLSSLLKRSSTISALEELGWGLQKQAGKEYRKQSVLGIPRGCLGRDGSLAEL